MSMLESHWFGEKRDHREPMLAGTALPTTAAIETMAYLRVKKAYGGQVFRFMIGLAILWFLSANPCTGQTVIKKPDILVDKLAPAPTQSPSPPATPAPPPKPIDLGEKPTVPGLPTLPPTTLSATQIPPFLDITRLTSEQWAGAISAAMEGTRLVYGPMTPEESRVFEAKWAPLFDHPFQEGVDWLNKLNPLLGQFLAIRATMADTAIQFDGAWKEAVTAAAIHDEQGVREALSIAYTERQMLVGQKKQLDQVIKDVLALGDPPSAAHHRRKLRQEEDDAVKNTKEIIAQMTGTVVPEAPREGRWVLTRTYSNWLVRQKYSNKVDATVASTANSATVTVNTVWPGATPAFPVSATWKTSWSTPPGVMGRYQWLEMKFACELVNHKGFDTRPERTALTGCMVNLDGWRSLPPDAVLSREKVEEGKAIDLSTLGEPGGGRIYWSGRSYEMGLLTAGGNPSNGPGNRWKYPEDFKREETHKTKWGWGTGAKEGREYLALCTQVELAGEVIFNRIYQYDWDPTGDTLQPVEGGDVGAVANEPEIKTRTPEELAEEIGFYEDNIKIIQANMAKDQAELGRTSDSNRRSELVNRIIVAQANIQAEQDRITTLQTGQIVHTRTAWDEMQSAAFIRNCQSEVNEMAARDRLRVGSLRMAGRADPQQAERLRKFILDHADPAADSAKLQKIAHIVFNQVQGDLEAKAARSEEEAISASQNLAYIESVKGTCDKAMFVGALLGGHPVMVAYEGSIGFVEGPHSDDGKSPKDPALGSRVFEGLKRAGAWYSTVTFVVSEAFEGYEKGGYIGGKENKGFWGAAERAGEAFMLAKSFEYLAGKVFGEPPKPGELPPRPTVKESFELARYRQECEYAKALVDDYKRTFEEYRRIQQFNASAAEMAAMEAQLRQKAASMHASFESKLYLKEIYGAGKEASMLEDYVFRIGQNHEATREAWFRKMEAMGYDDVRQWKLMEFRNSASAGSPGMDHDMGVWDKGEKFFKDRVRVSTHAMNEDAQKAWEKAYQETTGYSAKQSFENVTTSIHVEAYKDLSWIGDASIKHVKVNEILPGWAGQAADVTAVKNYDMFKNLNRLQAIIESGRGMAKDIQTKLLPVLEQGAAKFPKSSLRIRGGIDPATGKKVPGLMEKWSQIRDILKTAADNPVEADRKIRLLTGKSICEVTGDLRDLMADFGKVISR